MAFLEKLAQKNNQVKSTFFSLSDNINLGFGSQFFGLNRRNWLSTSYDKNVALLYRNPHAYRALDIVSQTMSSVEIEVVDEDDQVVENHPVLDLFDRPTPRMGRAQFFRLLMSHIYASGESFIHVPQRSSTGEPFRMYPFSEGQFGGFTRDGDGFVNGYRLTDPRTTISNYDIYSTDEVLHLRYADPTDPEHGIGAMQSATRPIQTFDAIMDWIKSIADAGGKIDGFFVPNNGDGFQGRQISPEKYEDAKNKLLDQYHDMRENSRPGVMSGNWMYQQIDSINPEDADWGEISKLYGRLVSISLGVDPALLGDSENKTYSNLESAKKALYEHTVLPQLDHILDEFNRWLMPKYGGNLKLRYNTSGIQALEENKNEQAERLVAATGGPFMSREEARKEYGLSPDTTDEIREPQQNPFGGIN